MTHPSDHVPEVYDSPAEGEQEVATVDEYYDYVVSSYYSVANRIKEQLGDDKLTEYVDASINSRPGPIWSQTMVMTRIMAQALRGADTKATTFKDMMSDSRIALSMWDQYFLLELKKADSQPFSDMWQSQLDEVFEHQSSYDDDTVSFDDYQIELLQRCQYVADLLSAKEATVQEAAELLKAFEAKQRAYIDAPLPEGHYMAYELLHRRVTDELTDDDYEGAAHNAVYLMEGLDEDALPAAKLFANDFLVRQRLGNHIRAYIDEEEFRSEKIKAWRALGDMLPGLAMDDDIANDIVEIKDVSLEKFKPLQVDWEVLPPGSLRDSAVAIVDGENSRNQSTEVRIDPDRLKVLEEVRTQWGADRAYYAKGSLRRRNTKQDESQRCPDQYIMLVLQDMSDDERMIEHAVAESPIAGPHAMYVFRQDVNPDVNWREVMSLDKREARALGARPLKHPSNLENGELVVLMCDRVSNLLVATPEEFVRIEFSGKYTRLKDTLAIKAFAAMQRAGAEAEDAL